LVTYLAGQGDEVKILAPAYDSFPGLPKGVELFPFRAFPLPFYKEVVMPAGLPGGIRRVLKRHLPDLVHVATEGPFGLSAVISARSLGIPVVSSFHTDFPQYFRLYGSNWMEGISWRYLRWFHNATLATLCPTPTIKKMLLDKGFRAVEIWGRGVDSELFHPRKRDEELRCSYGIAPDELLLLFVGRLAVEKNLQLLLSAWGLLSQNQPLRLMLIGDGPLMEQLRSQWGEKENSKVIFTGYKQGEELARHYASADLFVFPSLTETFGNVILEAMSSGLPVVSFKVQGPQDVVKEGLTGFFPAEISAAALSATVLKLLDQPWKLRAMGGHARKYAETQAWPLVLEKVRRCYEQVLADNGS
jgi:glycosyltransferase involved in cell wall biosynthesis